MPDGKSSEALSERFAKLENELRQTVADEIRKQSDRDREFLIKVIGAAVKILGIAVAVLTVVFTLLGVKTFRDIGDVVQVEATTEVKRRLESDDPQSPFRRDIDRIVNRALVSSWMVAIERKKMLSNAGVVNPKVEDPTIDLDRLLSMIQDPDLSQSEFKDVLSILREMVDDKTDTRIVSVIANLLSPQRNSKYAWVFRQPEKQVAILDGFTHRKLIDTVQSLVTAPGPTEVRYAAIKRCARDGNVAIVNDLDKLARSTQSPVLSEAALSALARLDPSNAQVAAAVQRFASAPFDRSLFLSGMGLAKELAEGPSDSQSRRKLIAQILSVAIENGLVLRYFSPRVHAEYRKPPSEVVASVSLAIGPSRMILSDGVDELLHSDSVNKDPGKLARYIRALTIKEAYGEQKRGVVRVLLELGGGAALVTTTVSVTAEMAPSGVMLTSRQDGGATINVKWEDAKGNTRSGILKGIEKIEGAHFDVVMPREFDEAVDDDPDRPSFPAP